jgi:hypothetical protein
MCDCTSCSYTDGFAGKGFAEWPRGNPGGRKSAREYAAHVKHSQQWGKDKEPEFSASDLRIRPEPYFGHSGGGGNGPSLVIPKGRYDSARKRWISPPTELREYIAEVERLNGLKKQEPVKAPARPETPAKAPQHFPAQDRPRETAKIYAMPKSKPAKRSRGRPALPGRFVVVKLEERLITKAEKLGGKVAAGIREALERAKVG